MMPGSLILGLFLLGAFFFEGGCTNNCSGRKILNGQEGFISDGQNPYKANSHCEWLIDAGSPNKTIHLTFESMETECSFDFLFIYDGKSYNSRLIATLSGDSPPRPVTAHSGYMLLYLFSDRNYMKNGFGARYKIFDCPWNCSHHGSCINHTCHCRAGYSGNGCEVDNCPNDCGEHGKCKFHRYHLQYCNCSPGYVGHKCDLQISGVEGQGRWYSVEEERQGSFPGRTSHTSVFAGDCIWVFGGFDLNHVLGDLWRYCMSHNAWERLDEKNNRNNEDKNVSWPRARSGHAIDSYGDGFFIFGGILEDGSHSSELWFFNITSNLWTFCASESETKPDKVTGHTLTTVGNYLYVLGGKTEERIFVDSMFRISAQSPDQWEEVIIKGGNYPPKRLVGHTTVYHKHSRSLIVFGGYTQDSALFSDRTREIQAFSIDDSYWSHLYNDDWRKDSIPRNRAFHSGVIMGNYLVVYGGNTHYHSGLEICYNQEIFFYHLGCHVWLNHTYFTGNITTNGMPAKGRFGHNAVVANGNVMFLIGGYSGQVLGDLIAYKVPSAIADFECSSTSGNCQSDADLNLETDHCEKYPNKNQRVCQDDPECVFCNQGRNDTGNHSCVHRTRVELCVNGDFHDSTDRCPGICPTLHTCGACVSQGKGVQLNTKSTRKRVYIEECSWCVKEAQCQLRRVPKGTCQAPEETESGIQGWWGGLSANLTTLHQCQVEDFPAGLHWVKYRHPLNISFPDELSIIRKTKGTMGYIASKLIESAFVYTSKFLGFIHPLSAPPPPGENLTLFLGLMNAKAWLYLSIDDKESKKEKVITMGEETTYNTLQASRGSGLQVFPNVSRGHKYFIEQVTEQTRSTSSHHMTASAQSTVTLGWNGCVQQLSKQHVITSEFLEPYSNGNCSTSYNCLGCLTDTLCSWCEVNRSCVRRNMSGDLCQDESRQQYLITSPAECPSCENYMQCSTCAADPLCEWVTENGHCTRRLRNQHGAVTDKDKCRPPCHHRTNCSDCITEKGECAWCENTRTCLPFSDYVTRYIYGQCTSWVDSIGPDTGCHSCENQSTCNTCLAEFGCGWCGNDHNPGIGVCVNGDFTGMDGNQTCSSLLNEVYNISITEPSSWSYNLCPDLEECALGLHDCHPNATCINVYASYRCECNHGFEGDGQIRCDETCYYKCHNGECSGPPDFVCECDLGWTNHSCNVDCGCNNHSTCKKGVGLCDACQHRTAGAVCDECVPGAYGNALDSLGCFPCNCNGHGDLNLGECDNVTGECFCTDNTQGNHCEHCKQGYYGNPRNGGKCYLRCDHRLFVTNITEGALGSFRGNGVEDRGHAYCLWVLTVFPDVQHTPPENAVIPTIVVTVEGDMEIECGQDAVYIYDGIPEFISGSPSGVVEPLGAFCGLNPGRDLTVSATSGTTTVFFEGDLLRSMSRGFNASYRTHACVDRCIGNQICVAGSCVCKTGYWGEKCLEPMCPFNCPQSSNQGYCHNGICICNPGYGGTGCRDRTSLNELRLQVLSDSKLASSLTAEDLRSPEFSHTKDFVDREAFGPSPRSGHSLTTCGEGLLFLFGGYSQHEGILNDMWMFNVSDKSWTEILPATDAGPSGRYHHSAACIPLLKMIFVFGGFVATVLDDYNNAISVQPTNSLWKFNIESYAWTRDQSPPWLPGLAGHTLTHVGSTNLMLVGGFAPDIYFNDKVYEYNVSNGLMAWQEHDRGKMKGSIPIGIYGHSAVYDHTTQTIYIFGGYLFRSDRWFVSRELFSFEAREKRWHMLYPDSHSEWESRVFHAAAHVGDAMVVVGGLTDDGTFAMDVLVYRYGCNTWHRLQFDDFELEQTTTTVIGLDAVSLGDAVYVFGGFAGLSVGTFSQLSLPLDICSFITDPIVCSNISGCQMCVLTLETGENMTVCYDSRRPNSTKPAGCVGASPEEKRCNLRNHKRRKCQRYRTCSQCLATHPQFKEYKDSGKNCVWCANCPTGRCVPQEEECPKEKSCPLSQHIIKEVEQCFEYMCPAADCEKCGKHGDCLWTRHFKRSSEIGRYFNQQPIYDWNCVTNGLKPSTTSKFTSMPPDKCPARCHTFRSCETCLSTTGSEGGSHECLWSEAVQECMAPAYMPLRCSLGECHFVRSGSQFNCPIRCEDQKKCADCITSPNCGWCAFGGRNGQGVCLPGGIAGPTQGNAACSEGNFSISLPFVDIVAEGKGKPELLTSHTAHTIWSFDKCQPENECMNQHHTCNPDTQDCYDSLEHFRCECKRGYVMNAGTNNCEPVCHQGCVHGVCVKPDDCRCDFGWVGSNCSVECLCNKHSNCKSVTEHMKCTQCENNTMGERCQDCQPMFVGNPENGGRCIPCREFCNNHTDICMTQQEYDLSLLDNFDSLKIGNRHNPHYRLMHKGPQEDEAICIKCQHNTTGTRCDMCTSGHFRKLNEPKTKPCRECHCNGHSNVCNVDTGENCQCKNNTETNCESKDEADCWEYQCAQCKEYFLGTPTSGHQCYRQMNVDRDYCFDPETQNNCNQFPKALRLGRTVFFAVQPKYLNVDIRITIDVTMGSSDVFISNKKDTFQVFVDKSSWLHNIYLDKMYASGRAGLARRSIMGGSDISGFDDEDIRQRLQLHESGSVEITESVPDYLKLKATDTEFYKMSQFQSMDKSATKSGSVSKIGKDGQRVNKTHSSHRRSGSSSKRRHGGKGDVQNDGDEITDGLKKFGKQKFKSQKTRKMHKNFQERFRKKMDLLKDYDIESIFRSLEELDTSSSLENESVLPVYEEFLARRRNTTASKKRHRRGITVTDTKKDTQNGAGNGGIKMGEINAGELNTYITVGQQNSVLVVRDVRFRLVITLPRDQHDLRSSRFYIIVRSRGGNSDNTTYGNLYFRQDQPHIDLFVFFSVFFSCFFLFLAVCVMLWKMKQTFDARRSRQMREREMECMASRPFARILVLLEHDEPIYLPFSSGIVRRRSRLGRYQNRNQYYNNNDINTISNLPPPREMGVVPIAIEPTEDSLAAVGTVLFQLPGGATAPSRLCLGSSLTTRISPPAPSQKSNNLRRRTSASSC